MKFEAKQGTVREIGLLFLLVAFGFSLRLPGFDGRALWVDELWRANLMLEKGSIFRYWDSPDLYTAITAPLYLLFNMLLGWVNPSPSGLRLSSLLPGLASIAVSFFIARKAGANLGWSIIAAALFAANSQFIHYSNEFKPYMFEVMVHLGCMYFWLELLTSNSSRLGQWVIFSVVLLIASFCTANIVFVLPAMFLSLLDKVLIQEKDKVVHLLASCFIVGCAVIGLYFFVWSYGSDKGLISYWADNFHNPIREGYLTFVVKKMFGMWIGAFSLVGTGRVMFVASMLGLVGALYSCCRSSLFSLQTVRGLIIYFLLFILTLFIINRMELWPIGQIRPNQFVFAIVAIWWVIFLSRTLSVRAQWLMVFIVVGVTLLGAAKTSWFYLKGLGPPFEQSDRVWSAFSISKPTGVAIFEQCKLKPVTVFINPSMSHAYNYYVKNNDSTITWSTLSSRCVAIKFVQDAYSNEDVLRSQIAAEQPSTGVQWYAFSHLNEQEVNKLKVLASEFGSIQIGESFQGAGYFSVVSVKDLK